MSTEISYKDLLRKDMLSSEAQVYLSEFALIWHMNTGELIDVYSDDAVMQVLSKAKRSNDRRSRSIYLHLWAEFTNKIQSSVAWCDAMLADQLLSHVSMGKECSLHRSQYVN